jgi:hypothetical protein
MMRVPAQCPRCREVNERRQSIHEVGPEEHSHELEAVYLREMDAADVHLGKLTLRCEQGHTTVVTLPIPAFEMLFDFGCSALLDGYPREAVTVPDGGFRSSATPIRAGLPQTRKVLRGRAEGHRVRQGRMVL